MNIPANPPPTSQSPVCGEFWQGGSALPFHMDTKVIMVVNLLLQAPHTQDIKIHFPHHGNDAPLESN